MPLDRIALNEKEYVEEPILRQLERLGWRIIRGDKYDPSVSLRESFKEVVIESELRESLKRINDWLEDDQITEIVREITTPDATSLIKANQEILELLLENTSRENRKTGERSETVRFIDFNNPDKNSFLAISQFKVNIPGTENHIVPDIVLFVNGLPLVVIECKSPYIADPIGEAVIQILRYSNQRGEREGNEKLFWYNQLVIATSRQSCRYSTITGEFEHFVEWKDPYPFSLSDIETEGSESINSQQVLIQGMISKQNLLDIVRCFTIFQENAKGKLIKIVSRYQQYRTVYKIIERLKSNKSPQEKGGIVWHTQGSGKSFTMIFAVRRMYRDKELAKYKIVFITDRKDLEKQLGDTAKGVGYTLKKADKINNLKKFLKTDTPDLIMGMIHKFQEHELMQEFPELNTSKKILVMIDEAHRTQYKLLGANLRKALPNSAKIAFTGTPIERTELTFGDYIDKYSIRQAVEDGVTVEIIYEGRTHKGEISDKEAMNKRFEDVFSEVDNETRQNILGRYTWRAYLEAEETIKDKARDMFEHYLTHIFVNGFKAQVVAVSRLAAIRYKKAFDGVLKEKIEFYQKQEDTKIDLEQLKKLRVEVVISGAPNDDPIYHPYTKEEEHEKIITSFKLPFGKTSEDGVVGDVGIILVQSMLLTGFDAPVEQVLYLDDVIKEHSLLQAIARVNRIEHNKNCGFVVDYVGIARHLREALAVFDAKDVEEMLNVVKSDEADIDALKYNHSLLLDFFKKYEINNINDVDACVDILADEETRNEFLSLFREFTKSMDRVLPKVEALAYANDLKIITFIGQTARTRYRDEKLNIKDASKKIRDIVDEYLISKGIDPKIPPLPIFSEEFKIRLNKSTSDKAKAEELEHAIAEHIRQHTEEDPELYERFAEKLEKLLKEYRENWELLAKELEALLEEIRKGRLGEETFGLDAKSEMPFLGLIKKEVFGVQNITELNDEQINLLVQTTKDILEITKREIKQIDFWNNYTAQKRLKAYIVSHLLIAFRGNNRIMSNKNALAQQLLELAFHLNEQLITK